MEEDGGREEKYLWYLSFVLRTEEDYHPSCYSSVVREMNLVRFGPGAGRGGGQTSPLEVTWGKAGLQVLPLSCPTQGHNS